MPTEELYNRRFFGMYPPRPGYFRLYDRATPALRAGSHVLQIEPEIRGDSGSVGDVDSYEGHIEVTAPRYFMPPDQILSTWPPANSEGDYDERLPQMVLKQRLMPWMRADDDDTPWLALIVLADGEGIVTDNAPVSECVTNGVELTGRADVATGSYVTVGRDVIDRVFPTRGDVSKLCHVREVDLSDTELAMGDDDGFMAVVVANRLPRHDHANNAPLGYTAMLVSLEGQFDVLPTAPPPVFEIERDGSLIDVGSIVGSLSGFGGSGGSSTGGGSGGSGGAGPARSSTPAGTLTPGSIEAGELVELADRHGGERDEPLVARRSASPARRAGAARRARAEIGGVTAPQPTSRATHAVAGTARAAAPMLGTSRIVGIARPVTLSAELLTAILGSRSTFRFPVLARWSFTSNGSGSFAEIMQSLDVGLLGTMPEPDGEATPIGRHASTTSTGHIGLTHLTRRGDHVEAWYRGPVGPHQTARERPQVPDGGTEPRLPLAHTSDQLRRVLPTGKEDLSRASAFEIGRLLALSNPAVISALMRWRRDRFGTLRKAALDEDYAGSLVAAIDGSIIDVLVDGVITIIDEPAPNYPPPVQWPPPGRELPDLPDLVVDVGELPTLIERGLGLPEGVLRETDRDRVIELLADAGPASFEAVDATVAELHQHLFDGVRGGLDAVLGGQSPLAASGDDVAPVLAGSAARPLELDMSQLDGLGLAPAAWRNPT